MVPAQLDRLARPEHQVLPAIQHRLQVCGISHSIFRKDAIDAIHQLAGGIPRLINVLCDRVLLAGYVARAPRVSAAIVRQAAKEIPDASRRRSSGVGKARAGDLAGAGRIAIVAHSMGGLVARSYLTDFVGDSPVIKLFVSLATPWGGDKMAAYGVEQSPAVIPCWIDLQPQGDFIQGIYRNKLPEAIDFYLFFGHRGSRNPLRSNNDGTITLEVNGRPISYVDDGGVPVAVAVQEAPVFVVHDVEDEVGRPPGRLRVGGLLERLGRRAGPLR